MRSRLSSRSGEIYDLLARAGANAHELAKTVDERFREYPGGPTQDEVKELEHEGDRVISELLTTANAVFVTPIDRDDLVTLAFAVDDVADSIENASELLGLYGVEGSTRQAIQLTGLLVRATEQLAALLARLKDVRGSAEEVRAIKAIEDEADEVARNARAGLFKDDRIDPTIVIRWKDIYEALEDAVDFCDTAANRIGNILVKNA
jgi:predicted phosphate transport protein (TIGR00153 family)